MTTTTFRFTGVELSPHIFESYVGNTRVVYKLYRYPCKTYDCVIEYYRGGRLYHLVRKEISRQLYGDMMEYSICH